MKSFFVIFTILITLFCGCLKAIVHDRSKICHYYCTVADERHFDMLMNLIGSIHKADFDSLDQIAIFDVGLTLSQKGILERIKKAKVYEIEKVHPEIFTYFKTSPAGRTVRGWFLWKPVVIKQALDMFPYMLYLDSGTLVLRSPDNLFKHIKQNGYFLMEISPHSIEASVTKPVIEKVISKLPKDQQELLMNPKTPMIDAGFQGISRDIYNNYVMPTYRLASDITLFEDDGSSKLGFGSGRHDQTLFSVYAHLGKFNLNSQGWTLLKVDGENIPFHIHWDRGSVNNQTTIYRSRGDYLYGGDKTVFIHWVPKLNAPLSSEPKKI